MIISELSYLETEIEANDLQGGFNLGLNWTDFLQQQSALQTAAVSSPAGSAATTGGATLKIDTHALSLLGLNFP